MTNRSDIPPPDAEDRVARALEDLFVEFLRAISAEQVEHRTDSIIVAMYRFINAWAECGGPGADQVTGAAMLGILMDARGGYPEYGSIDPVANAACKVIAERITGHNTQRNLAEQRLFERIKHFENARRERRGQQRP